MNKIEFYTALEENDIKEIINLIKSSKNLDEYNLDSHFEFPLNNTIKKNNFEVVKLLVESGANVNVRGGLCAVTAVKEDNMEILNYLIEKGIKFDNYEEIYENGDFTAIEMAINYGNLRMVNRLLELNVSLEGHYDISENSHSAMEHAVSLDQIDIIIRLIEAGEDPNKFYHIEGSDDIGKTPLFVAIRYGKEKIDKLIELGADINYEDEDEDNYREIPSAILYATDLYSREYEPEDIKRRLDIISYLIDLGANMNSIKIFGNENENENDFLKNVFIENSLLLYLFKIKDIELIHFFVNKGIDINQYFEVKNKKVSVFEYFIEKEFDINDYNFTKSLLELELGEQKHFEKQKYFEKQKHFEKRKHFDKLEYVKSLLDVGIIVSENFIERINEKDFKHLFRTRQIPTENS